MTDFRSFPGVWVSRESRGRMGYLITTRKPRNSAGWMISESDDPFSEWISRQAFEAMSGLILQPGERVQVNLKISWSRHG